jgi:hypothetical protein
MTRAGLVNQPPDSVQCDCGEMAQLDLTEGKHAPRVEGAKMLVNYVCPKEHRFERVLELKTGG